jgi:hypothetical protein
MVTWKKNNKYIKKASKAKVVDLLKLQNMHPDRMEIVVKEAREWHLQYDRVSLVKVWDDWFVYGLKVNGQEMQDTILVNSKHDIRIGKIFNMRNLYFTNFEIDFWRGEVLAELLRIQKEAPNIDNELIAREMSFLDNNKCLRMMSDGNVYPDLIEDAREYANIITM